jgi:molybdate transport system permease protein
MNIEALLLSIRLALCVAAILFVLGVPLAYWLAYSRWRWKFLLEAVVALPLVLPPTVLGFYMLLAMGPRGPLGKLWQAAFETVDRTLLDASAVLGAGAFRTFLRVILPLSVPGIITALVLSFAHTLGEFGVVLMVGGNLAGVTRTVSIDIYDRVQSLDFAGAGQTALLLLVISFAVLSAVYGMNRRAARRAWLPWGAK